MTAAVRQAILSLVGDENRWIYYFPYLPLDRRVSVGAVSLVPVHLLGLSDCRSEFLMKAAVLLASAYATNSYAEHVGAFICPTDGIGTQMAFLETRSIRLGVAVATLDANPPYDDDGLNGGLRRVTGDNCDLFGHHIDDDLQIVTRRGAIVTGLNSGIQLGVTKLPPPVELSLPSMWNYEFDDELASTIAKNLRQKGEWSGRLMQTIDGLILAYRNASTLSTDMRLITLKVAFEVLLGTSAKDDLASALSKQLAAKSNKTLRTWVDGKQKTKHLTDEAWWMIRFCLLRDKLVHGGVPDQDEFHHEEVHHLYMAFHYLLDALRWRVSKLSGTKDLRCQLRERENRRRHDEVLEALKGLDESSV